MANGDHAADAIESERVCDFFPEQPRPREKSGLLQASRTHQNRRTGAAFEAANHSKNSCEKGQVLDPREAAPTLGFEGSTGCADSKRARTWGVRRQSLPQPGRNVRPCIGITGWPSGNDGGLDALEFLA